MTEVKNGQMLKIQGLHDDRKEQAGKYTVSLS